MTPLLFVIGCWSLYNKEISSTLFCNKIYFVLPSVKIGKINFMGKPKICKQLKNHRLAHLSSAYLEYWSPASTSLSPPNSRNSLNKADNNEVLPLEAPPGVAILQLTIKNLFSEFWHYLLPVWAVQKEGRKICLWSLEGWNIQFLFFILTWYHNVWNLVWCQEKDAFEKRSTGWSPRPTPSSSSSSRRSSLQWWQLWGGADQNYCPRDDLASLKLLHRKMPIIIHLCYIFVPPVFVCWIERHSGATSLRPGEEL